VSDLESSFCNLAVNDFPDHKKFLNVTFLPVGDIPRNSPVWVAVISERIQTLSPFAIMSLITRCISGKALRNTD